MGVLTSIKAYTDLAAKSLGLAADFWKRSSEELSKEFLYLRRGKSIKDSIVVHVDWRAGIQENVSANWEVNEGVIGRTSPFYFYRGTGEEQVTIPVILYPFDSESIKDPRNKYLWIKARQYPESLSGVIVGPPETVYFSVGAISGYCLVRGAQVSWTDIWQDGYPLFGRINLVLSILREQQLTAESVMKQIGKDKMGKVTSVTVRKM